MQNTLWMVLTTPGPKQSLTLGTPTCSKWKRFLLSPSHLPLSCHCFMRSSSAIVLTMVQRSCSNAQGPPELLLLIKQIPQQKCFLCQGPGKSTDRVTDALLVLSEGMLQMGKFWVSVIACSAMTLPCLSNPLSSQLNKPNSLHHHFYALFSTPLIILTAFPRLKPFSPEPSWSALHGTA